jgi:pimeloyl-ACP methyl ester carboxylesterase
MSVAWPIEDWDGFVGRWLAACADDAGLAGFAGGWSVCFAIASGNAQAVFTFENGRIAPRGPAPAFSFTAPASVWEKFLQPVPPRHHHVVLAMLARLPEVSLDGDSLAFAQHCHVVRRVLEVGKWLALGNALPAPRALRPSLKPQPSVQTQAAMLDVPIRGIPHRIAYEHAGTGHDILCLHTAGSDLRQFHRLMANPAITDGHRLVAFDLPWHGRSAPVPGAVLGSWKLTTDFYVETIMAFVKASGLNRPIVLGASMSGEICLELALRHPEAFRGIIACEATANVPNRQTPWAFHPEINQSLFVPEWIHGLMAPQSPAECADEVLWHYAQGGPGVFRGDIHFYSGEWNATDRVHRIDTNRCPLVMLTGEYDYSCTAEMSEATAAKIPGVRFRRMEGMGHFPFAENPPLFAEYLLPELERL